MYMSRGSSFICWEELGIVIPHFKEELPVKRQVYVFTETLNDWPSLADGCAAFL